MSSTTEPTPTLENQNLIDGTPLFTTALSIIDSVRNNYPSNKLVTRLYVDSGVSMTDVKSVYEAKAVKSLQDGGLETPGFLIGAYKLYLEKTMKQNLKVNYPFSSPPTKMFVHEDDEGEIFLGFSGVVFYSPVRGDKKDGKTPYVLGVVMPVLPYKKESWFNLFMRTTTNTRALSQGKFLKGLYTVAIHGFYAASQEEVNTEIHKAANFCLNSPNDNFYVHQVKKDIPACGLSKLTPECIGEVFCGITKGLGKGSPTSDCDILDTDKVSNDAFSQIMEDFSAISSEFKYKEIDGEAASSPNTPVTTVLFEYV